MGDFHPDVQTLLNTSVFFLGFEASLQGGLALTLTLNRGACRLLRQMFVVSVSGGTLVISRMSGMYFPGYETK